MKFVLLLFISAFLSLWIPNTIDKHYRNTWKWYADMVESKNIIFTTIATIVYIGLLFLIAGGVAFFAGYEW